MALPTSRNTTYAAGSQVKSADLNDLQDKVIDEYTYRKALRTRKVHWSAGIQDPEEFGTVLWDAVSSGTSGYIQTNSGGQLSHWYMPIDLEVGQRLRAVRARVRTHNTEWITLSVKRLNGDGTETVLGTDNSTTGSGVIYENVTVTGLTETVVAGSHAYFGLIETTSGTSDLRFMHLEYDYDYGA